MAQTIVSDFVIWTKHIHGDAQIEKRILGLREGETLDLKVDGVVGTWNRMKDGKDGRPTPGIRPVGKAKDFWRELYDARRGDLVSLELLGPADLNGPQNTLTRTSDSKREALEAYLALSGQGWRSEGRTFDRDEMHER